MTLTWIMPRFNGLRLSKALEVVAKRSSVHIISWEECSLYTLALFAWSIPTFCGDKIK